jgi:hypothetical protein
VTREQLEHLIRAAAVMEKARAAIERIFRSEVAL